MEGALPDTWHAVSPHRVAFPLTLINDWMLDDPITVAAKALLPEWVRWHGEQAGLSEHRDGILAALRRGVNNGRAEGLNNHLRLIIPRACGFHSAQAAALAPVVLSCGPIELH